MHQNRLVTCTAKNINRKIVLPFAIAGETLQSANFTLVQLQDEMGRVGIGEGSPLPILTGDTVETVLTTTNEILSSFKDHNCLMAMTTMRKNREEWFTTSPSAYVGVEMALWDLFGKQVGLPLAALWGQRMIDEIMTDMTLPLMEADKVESFWKTFSSYGFEVIKIKVSGVVDYDLDLISAICKLLPHGTQITLDGNSSYGFGNAMELLNQLSRFNIQPLFFEQPLPSDNWDGLKALEKESGIPVCLDETVVTPEDAIKVVQNQTASMINLKITKSGIEETMRIISIARSAGIALMIGGMLESEIAMATSLQLACGAGWISHFDLDTPFFFAEPVTTDSPWHQKNAVLRCPKTPGIGVEVLESLR